VSIGNNKLLISLPATPYHTVHNKMSQAKP
jgi:hypothetical protein